MNALLTRASWVLRVGVAGEFIGHGIFALSIKESWFKYLEAVGIYAPLASYVMQAVGIMDIIVGLSILCMPHTTLLLWATIWGALTAFIRPLAGDSWLDFIERWANWAAPLALYLLTLYKKDEGK